MFCFFKENCKNERSKHCSPCTWSILELLHSLQNSSTWQICLFKCCISITQTELSAFIMAFYKTAVDFAMKLKSAAVKSKVRRSNYSDTDLTSLILTLSCCSCSPASLYSCLVELSINRFGFYQWGCVPFFFFFLLLFTNGKGTKGESKM